MSDRKRKLDVFSGDAGAAQNGSALVSSLTGRPYSQKYHDILSKRKGAERLMHNVATTFYLEYRVGHLATSCIKATTPGTIRALIRLPSSCLQDCLCGRRATTS